MKLRHLFDGSFTSGNYVFSGKNDEKIVVDKIGEYLIKTFPDRFEKVRESAIEPEPIKKPYKTSPARKTKTKRASRKKEE